MEETKTPWSVYVVYMLVLIFMMVAGTVKGQNDPLTIHSKDAKTKSEKTSAA